MTTPRLVGTHHHHTDNLFGPGIGSGSGSAGAVPDFTNADAGSIELGDVVVLDKFADRSVFRTTNYADLDVVGVVADTGPFATGATDVPVLVNGFTDTVKVTGTVNVGDYLVTDSTSGKAISAGPNPATGAFARAVTVAAAGIVSAVLFEVIIVVDTAVPEKVWFDMTGMTNSSDTTFNTPDFFIENSTEVFLNGLMQRPLVDYNESTTLDGIVMVAAPTTGDELVVVYRAQVI